MGNRRRFFYVSAGVLVQAQRRFWCFFQHQKHRSGRGVIANGRFWCFFVLGVEKNAKNGDGAEEMMEREDQEMRNIYRRAF